MELLRSEFDKANFIPIVISLNEIVFCKSNLEELEEE